MRRSRVRSSARLDAELLDQRPPGVPIGAQGVGLAARPVEGEHELLVQSLSQGHLADQLGEWADRVAVAAEPELQVHPAFRRRPAQLVEPGDLAAGELEAGHVLQRVAPPQCQGALGLIQRVEQLRLGPKGLQRCERSCGDLEPMRIDLLRVHHQGVATGLRLEDRGPARVGGTKGLAKIGDLDLEHVGRIARQLVAPQHVDEEVPTSPCGPDAAPARPGSFGVARA